MPISFNYKDSFGTEITTTNKSMGFDPSAIHRVSPILIIASASADASGDEAAAQ